MPKRILGTFFGVFCVLFLVFNRPVTAQRAQSSSPRSKALNQVKLIPIVTPLTKRLPETDPTSFIVRFKPDTTPNQLQTRSRERLQRGQSVLGRMLNTAENASLYVRREDTPERLLERLQKTKKQSGVAKEEPLPTQNAEVLFVNDTNTLQTAINNYKSNPTVQAVQPNYIYRASATVPNDTFYSTHQWDLRKMQVDSAWDTTTGSPTVKIAVLDTGINTQHEDFTESNRQLSPTIIKGACFANHGVYPLPTTLPGVTPQPDPCLQSTHEVPAYSCPTGNTAEEDNIWACGGGHGSQMSGIIKATLNNDRGITGIAPGVTLLAIKVMDKYGQGTSASLLSGITEAKNQGAKIISMSLGGPHEPGEDQVVSEAIADAINHNIVVFAAAGNDGTSIKNEFPANDPSVITVGATGPNDERSSYSNYGEASYSVEVSAPGGNPGAACTAGNCIASTGWDCASQGGSNTACYPMGAGTSQATAHASAVAALLLSKKPTLTPNEIKDILIRTADPVTTDTNKPIGKRINALKAMQEVAGVTAVVPTATPQNTSPTPLPATPTPGPAITLIAGRVINFSQSTSLSGLSIELAFNAPSGFFNPPPSPVILDSGGNFSFRFQTDNLSVVGRKVSVQFIVKEIPTNRIIRKSQPFDIAIGQEISGLTFTVYYCLTKTHGDANCDGVVDARDYLVWKTEYRDSIANPFQLGRADFDGDGIVNLTDYGFLIGKF